MGVGGSKSPAVGLPANPRVIYAENKSRQEKAPVLIDTPSLRKFPEGTVRYRFCEQASAARSCRERVERPHEGRERGHKLGYFYHSRLNDFSSDASYDKEQDWKFRYVYKGPNRTRQKQLFFVYGKGLKSSGQLGGEKQKSPCPHDDQPATSQQLDGHLYYDMILIPQAASSRGCSDGEEEDVEETEHKQQLELFVNGRDNAEKLKRILSLHLITSPERIHVFIHKQEISEDSVLGDYHPSAHSGTRIRVLLRKK